jgi:hypothetical protein
MTGTSFKSRDSSIEDFNRRGNRQDGEQVAASLDAGLSVVRDLMYERMHADVERVVGKDSMLIPLSELETQQQAETAIELFQIAESACIVRDADYAGAGDEWYANWLAQMRLRQRAGEPDNARQLAAYLAMHDNDRRLAFSDVLFKVLPESRQAPLVLFRLAPLATRIATADAFGDRKRATEIRKTQKTLLPGISDCRECHGDILDSGEICDVCGNPLWNFEWLTTAD